jgi:pimeloyl-ACP methyl ester carboxylesterase
MRKSIITLERFEIPVVIAGSGSDTLVCINGMQQTMAAWRSVVNRFRRERRYQVILFDFPHQGRAVVRSGAGPVGLMEQVEIVRAVVAHVSGGRPVDLLGGSWGATVGAAFAAEAPSAVRRMVLGSFQARANRRLRGLARRTRSLIECRRTDAIAELIITEFGAGTPPGYHAALRQQFDRLQPEQFWQIHEQAEILLNAIDLGVFVDLRRITAETLIVNGSADAIVDARDTEGTVDRIPGARLHVVPGAGHFLHVERPDILDVYAEFFTSPMRIVPAA